MKKIGLTFLGVLASLMLLTTSCDAMYGFAEGYSEGSSATSRGYTYIGIKDSKSKCESACDSKGYTYYEYSTSTGNCFCK